MIIVGCTTYLSLSASPWSDEQTAVAFSSLDGSLQQASKLLLCDCVRGRPRFLVFALFLYIRDSQMMEGTKGSTLLCMKAGV